MKKIICILLSAVMLMSCASTEKSTDVCLKLDEYPEYRYVAAVGYGESREEAELNAKSELVAMFGAAVETSMREEIDSVAGERNGRSFADDVTTFTSTSSVSYSIGSVWGMKIGMSSEGRHGWESIAYVEKKPTSDWYKANLPLFMDDIEETLEILKTERGSWKAVGTANRLTQMIEDYNKDVGIHNYLTGESYEYYNASKTMTLIEDVRDSVSVYVNVVGDDSGYLESVIENTFTELGWRISPDTETATVVLDAKISWNVENGSGNSYIFAYYDSSMSFKDNATGHTIDVFALDGKEGHKSESTAKKRALKVLSEGYVSELRSVLENKEVR